MILRQRLVAISIFLGAALSVVAVAARSDDSSSRASQFHLLFAADPAQASNSEISLIEIGHSGVVVRSGDPEAGLINTFLEGCRLTIESDGGKLLVSAQPRDSSGEAATLFRNAWSGPSHSRSWDRNHTDDALEVRNPDGRVMLQIRVMADRIQIEGEWWDQAGNGVRLGTNRQDSSAFITKLSREKNPDEPMIEPMFLYPSGLHFGKLSERSQQLPAQPL